MTTEETNAAIDELLASKSPKEVAALLDGRDHRRLHAEEDAKEHALDTVEFSDDQWNGFFAHLLDGGGVRQDELQLDAGPSLRDQFHGALMNRDRKATLHLMPHVVKSLLKRVGARRVIRPGVVSAGPVQGVAIPKGETHENGT